MELEDIKNENDARQALMRKIISITRALKEDDFKEIFRQSQFYENLRQYASGKFKIDTTPYDNIIKELVPAFFRDGFQC